METIQSTRNFFNGGVESFSNAFPGEFRREDFSESPIVVALSAVALFAIEEVVVQRRLLFGGGLFIGLIVLEAMVFRARQMALQEMEEEKQEKGELVPSTQSLETLPAPLTLLEAIREENKQERTAKSQNPQERNKSVAERYAEWTKGP